MSWFPQVGWMELKDEDAQQLELNLNYRWQIWRIEWFNYGIGLKVKPVGPRFEPEAVKPKRKRKA